jgi:hypothetical protein
MFIKIRDIATANIPPLGHPFMNKGELKISRRISVNSPFHKKGGTRSGRDIEYPLRHNRGTIIYASHSPVAAQIIYVYHI